MYSSPFYFWNSNAHHVNAMRVLTPFAGEWFSTIDPEESSVFSMVTLSVYLRYRAGRHWSGKIWCEMTADTKGVYGRSRVLMPLASLDTSFAGIVLPSSGLEVTLTNVESLAANNAAGCGELGAALSLSIAHPGAGVMRFWIQTTNVHDLTEEDNVLPNAMGGNSENLTDRYPRQLNAIRGYIVGAP